MYAMTTRLANRTVSRAYKTKPAANSLENQSNTIKACINGDAGAQRALYEAYRVRWYMTSMRYGKDKMQAEDILQEGLINIYKNLHQYDERKGAFSTWSNRVIVHAALRYLKRFSWTHAMGDIDEGLEIVSEDADIFDQLGAQELTRMIQQLPIGYRLVFNMYVIEGYKHEEIAQELGIKIGTSKSQYFKARKTLRNNLENQLIEQRDA